MKATISIAMAAALLVTLPSCRMEQETDSNVATGAAEEASLAALSGTWKADLATLKFEGRPDEMLLKDGTYSCPSCTPPLTVAADGAAHAVADRPYYDHISVKVVDDKTVEFRRTKAGREVGIATDTVSADGKVLTTRFKNMNNPNQTIEGTETARRVGDAPAGAHAISGKWQPDKVSDYSEDALNVTFAIDGDSVTMTGAGESYTAVLGGPAVAIKGDTGGTTVKVSREGAGGLRETFIRDGKEVGNTVTMPSADGRSITVVNTNARNGTKATWTATKQS